MRICCYTSFTLAYVGRALVLARSIKRAHPEWDLCAVVIDEPPAESDLDRLTRTFDIVRYPQQLGIPAWRGWLFKHDIVEACTAVKGHVLVHLLELYDAVVYLDPDVVVFSPFEGLEESLNRYAVLLTPHQTEPNTTQSFIRDNEATSLLFGSYNLGFLAVKRSPEGLRFARWWANMLHDACYDDIRSGVFTDQKYCDLGPGLFDGVHIVRDPGWNVASWNLSARDIAITRRGDIRVDGRPLVFYHFSKIGQEGDAMTARYGGSNSVVHEIWEWYRREIERNEPSDPQEFKWSYGFFGNGVAIDKDARRLYRSRQDLIEAFPDPFADGYWQWLQANRRFRQADQAELDID